MAFNRGLGSILSLALCLIAVNAEASTDRVFLIGDSEAYLLNVPLAKLAKRDNVPFGAAPVPGSSVISWAIANQAGWQALSRFQPTVVLVSLGANDSCMSTRIVNNEPPYLARFLRNLASKKVIWIGPPVIGAKEGCGLKDCLSRAIPGLEAFATMVKNQQVPYWDARELILPMWDDFLHPTTVGQQTWATWIWARLRVLLV